MNVSAPPIDSRGKQNSIISFERRRAVTTLHEHDPLSREVVNQLVLTIATRQDRQAFAELFNFAAPRIKAFMMRSGSTAEIAEEIAQEAMLVVWRKATYFDPARASAMTWIFTIARNLRIDFQRKSRSSNQPYGDETEVMQAAEPTPEEILFIRADEEKVRAALQALSSEQEEIIRLSFFRDRPHSEIARELDLPLGTVKSRIRRALGKLRDMLEETL
ncbi:sigma-70 family RNA polymerase sigma factor [Rhizobium sp. BK491]|uniref:sigma-70 family RNA polymerase sigma factor n=1 Tax=Rhizobium sp. BK491 TaxID=2587009 RepID=UPI00161B6275|nr:sigma-70 family RNA polymerase sigma factor [Rhizobium sp. BK491]MBB3572005.1 RNA polymerase sigma-70 factor (ECF subfamily) [Rhizobium sp. BK491]